MVCKSRADFIKDDGSSIRADAVRND